MNDESPVVKDHVNGFLKFKKRKEKQEVKPINMTNGDRNVMLNEPEPNSPVSVILERASANWLPQQLPPTLCHVSMEIKKGELCTLIGSVGSGKSSILHLLLRELPVGAGKVKLQSNEGTLDNKQGYVVDNPNLRISYASQEPWLFSGTVRENILFGQPYNRERYVAVSSSC